MTSIRVSFVSPFPIDCPSCGFEIAYEYVSEEDSKRNLYRHYYATCPNCETQYKIKQIRPFYPEPEIIRQK